MNKIKGEWAYSFEQEEHEIYVDRLGNLTLLGPSAQGRAGNKNFDDKKEVYETDTDMIMTRNLTQYNKWTIQEIEDRQKFMADQLVGIFTLNVDKIK